jgi:hypothetical protein
VDKLNPDTDAGKQYKGGETLDLSLSYRVATWREFFARLKKRSMRLRKA